MRMLISGFSPTKELGTRANQKISGYNRIRVDGCKRFEYAVCGRVNFRIRKTIFAAKINFRIRVDMALIKVAYYSFPKKKIKLLESVKLKQQEVSSEVLVTAIVVKCNFTEQINANQGKMLNIVTELLEGELETIHFKGFFIENQPYNPTSKFQDFRKREKIIM